VDDTLTITGIRLFERKVGNNVVDRSILFPDRQPSLFQTNGEYVSIAIVNTTDVDFRNDIKDKCFEAYDQHPKNPKNMKKEPTSNNQYSNIQNQIQEEVEEVEPTKPAIDVASS
jgi:hypothetical protein